MIGVVAVVVIWAWQFQGRLAQPKQVRFTVAATIFPLADIAKQIGGENVRVVLVIPPGVSEHANPLTPQKLQELQNTQIIFQISSGLDDHLVEKIAGTFSGVKPIAVDRDIVLQEFDPHYWLAVPNAMKIAQTIAEELTQLDPENGPAYAGRLADYQNRLVELEAQLQAMATSTKHKEFIAMHNAWSYFASQYGLRLVATYEPTEGKEPSLQDLQRLQGIVRQYELTTFYAEPQKSSGAVSEFMRREFGLKALTLDPVGGQAGKASYIDLMRANMAAVAEG